MGKGEVIKREMFWGLYEAKSQHGTSSGWLNSEDYWQYRPTKRRRYELRQVAELEASKWSRRTYARPFWVVTRKKAKPIEFTTRITSAGGLNGFSDIAKQLRAFEGKLVEVAIKVK